MHWLDNFRLRELFQRAVERGKGIIKAIACGLETAACLVQFLKARCLLFARVLHLRVQFFTLLM